MFSNKRYKSEKFRNDCNYVNYVKTIFMNLFSACRNLHSFTLLISSTSWNPKNQNWFYGMFTEMDIITMLVICTQMAIHGVSKKGKTNQFTIMHLSMRNIRKLKALLCFIFGIKVLALNEYFYLYVANHSIRFWFQFLFPY